MKKITSLWLFLLCFSITALAQFPAPYCAVTGGATVEPITIVEFADINETFPTPVGGPTHVDNLSIIGNVTPGETYTIVLGGNTGGNWTNSFRVYFDWNQDNDFTDDGEGFYVGTIVNSDGSPGSQTTSISIDVPADATEGTTRMRIVKRFTGADGSIGDPCVIGSSFGQARDFTLNVGAGGGGGDSVLIDFEGPGETKTAYASGTVNLSGFDFDMTEAVIGTLAADFRNGERSARFRGRDGSSMTMLEDKPNGLGEISFLYRIYGSDGDQQPWAVEYSSDGGDNWIQIGGSFTATADVQTFSETVEVEGDVRVRIRIDSEPGNTGNRRMNVDDILLTNFTSGGGNGNEWVVNVQGAGWGDEVSWELRDNGGVVLLSGGPYGNGYNDTQSVTTSNEPLEFFIEAIGPFNDNSPNYTVSCSGEVIVTGTLAGGAQTTHSDLECEGGGGGGGPFPEPYCGPLNFTIDVEPISRVIVADIDNASSPVLNGSPAHEDFTSIVGNMQQGESYSIALEGNTGGNWENRFVVFIDWNQNGILDDEGEVYEMNNTITNSTGVDGQQALGTIVVPEDALEGETRMRVKKIFGTANFLDPCQGAGFGQAEDYTINVVGPDPCLVEMFPFTETFEANSPSRDCWTQIQEVGSGSWTFAAGSSGGAITTANSGALNARFVSTPGTNTPVTKLVSPPMNLEALGEAEMTFFYGQEVWAGDQNQLRVYYRVNANSDWVEIASYLNNVPSWTQATVTLPNLSTAYQIAFEGINNWGRANVVDDVTIFATPPPNDLIENAISVTDLDQPYTDAGARLQYATNELLNPDGCNIAGTNGVWYSFTAAFDGSAEASVTTPAGTTAVIFYEAPNESVANETELTFVFDMQNQCAPSSSSSIPTVGGQSYYIFVLNTGGSSDVVIDISESMSIDDNSIDGFVFYPNPADNILNLKSNVTIDQVELFTVLGQSVMTRSINATSSQLDISRLSTGIYLMKVTADGNTATYQVIKR
jgi:hypothetical protein